MKTIKITEEAHKALAIAQMKLYEITGKKLTFSEVIERFYIEEYKNEKK